MADTSPQTGKTNTYFINAESATESARLMYQDRLLTQLLGGLLPHIDLSNVHDILDIGCGPGGWALSVASTYPEKKVVGVDISQIMIQYANAQALTQQLENATFIVADVLQPFPFPNTSFDLINARLVRNFLSKTTWSTMLQECHRVLRPGGILRLTEAEIPVTNSVALDRLNAIYLHAVSQMGRCFAPQGTNLAITAMLGHFLRNAGLKNIQHMAHAIDFSSGSQYHDDMFQDVLVFYELVKPFLIEKGGTTEEEFAGLYQQLQLEKHSTDFCAVWYYLSVWGQKL
jgi:ubiquinone/menaquinone biosynthesis C-methylase UbiE